mmetsp:Transcript_18689/g.34624  ORF Transcript_18689/g.34624 Transcript_18689/m.34624 type:complete len:236 (-) Transcript_18689:442-1149(-)
MSMRAQPWNSTRTALGSLSLSTGHSPFAAPEVTKSPFTRFRRCCLLTNHERASSGWPKTFRPDPLATISLSIQVVTAISPASLHSQSSGLRQVFRGPITTRPLPPPSARNRETPGGFAKRVPRTSMVGTTCLMAAEISSLEYGSSRTGRSFFNTKPHSASTPRVCTGGKSTVLRGPSRASDIMSALCAYTSATNGSRNPIFSCTGLAVAPILYPMLRQGAPWRSTRAAEVNFCIS